MQFVVCSINQIIKYAISLKDESRKINSNFSFIAGWIWQHISLFFGDVFFQWFLDKVMNIFGLCQLVTSWRWFVYFVLIFWSFSWFGIWFICSWKSKTSVKILIITIKIYLLPLSSSIRMLAKGWKGPLYR